MKSYISEEGLLVGEDGGRIWKDLNYVKLIQILEEAPIETWFQEILEKHAEREKQKTEVKERLLYEQLSKKFGKS